MSDICHFVQKFLGKFFRNVDFLIQLVGGLFFTGASHYAHLVNKSERNYTYVTTKSEFHIFRIIHARFKSNCLKCVLSISRKEPYECKFTIVDGIIFVTIVSRYA